MAVSKRLRYEVLRRDDHACRYCGDRAPDVKLTVDHVLPVALGGTDDPSNLVAACAACNSGKSSSTPDAPLVAGVSDDALRWARAVSEAAEARERDRAWIDEGIESFDATWRRWNLAGEPVYRDENWKFSIERILIAGLPSVAINRAAERALTDNRLYPDRMWRYFCGICWKEVKALQGEAQSHLESAEDVIPDNIRFTDEAAFEHIQRQIWMTGKSGLGPDVQPYQVKGNKLYVCCRTEEWATVVHETAKDLIVLVNDVVGDGRIHKIVYRVMPSVFEGLVLA